MRLGIRGLLTLGLAGLLLVAGTVAGTLVVRHAAAEAEAQVTAAQRGRLEAIGARLEAICLDPVACQDAVAAELRGDPSLRVLVALGSDLTPWAGRLRGAPDPVVLDAAQGRTLAWRVAPRPQAHPAGPGVDHHVARPLVLKGGLTGVVYAAFSLDPLRAGVSQRQREVLLYLALAFGGVLVFGIYLSGRALVQPIRALTEAARGVDAAAPDPSSIPVLAGPAELVQLSEAFRDLVGRLGEQNEALAHSLGALAAAQGDLVRTEKLATVGRLAAGVAHEVGNPLAAVLGCLEFLSDGVVDPAQRADLLGRMGVELSRMRETIRQLLDFSRPAAGEAVEVAPREVVDSAVELVRFQARMRDVQVRISGAAPRVVADPDRVRQVLVNLLLNAADAMGGAGAIEVALSAEGAGARIEVRDEGSGVGLEEAELIFEPFHSTKPRGEGTGLGLAISARLVEEGGGRLWLAPPTPGQGACFVFTLPARLSRGA